MAYGLKNVSAYSVELTPDRCALIVQLDTVRAQVIPVRLQVFVRNNFGHVDA